MIVSYRWLQHVAPGLSLSPEQVAERLASRGAPVERMDDLGARFSGLQVARVLGVERHPDADRLTLCRVDAGGAEPVQVICGAPNVKQGGWYPFAPVGSTLPGGTKIKRAKIRGVHSEGMLCSERELELGRDHAGILELEGEFTAGQPLTEALGMADVRFDVEVSPNRGDLLSHLGVARELAPAGHGGLILPPVPGGHPYEATVAADPGEAESAGVRIRVDEPDLCTRFMAVVLRGVRVGPSPDWLANRLRAVGSQPINNVVDVTNYAMLEMGHPMHAYDLAKLDQAAVVVRLAREGETLRTLDGSVRSLTSDMIAVCDGSEPVGIGGIMGGADSEVSGATTDVLLECALWSPPNIRATRRALDLSTEASYRFERGVDPALHETAIRRAAEMLLAVAGGEADGQLIDVGGRIWSPAHVPLRPSRVTHLLGVPFEATRIRELLQPLGFEVSPGPGGVEALSVTVPGFRSHDVRREVDLIEEVARTHGYDAFPDGLGPFRPGTVPDDPLFQLEDRLRSMLVARGLLEAHVPAFAPESEGEVALNNPISSNDSHMRRFLLPGLVRRVEHNFARGNRTVRLFELGTAFRAPGDPGGAPDEDPSLAIVLTGLRRPPHWSERDVEIDVWELKGIAESVARVAYRGAARLEPATLEHPTLDAAGLAVLDDAGRRVGSIGTIRGDALDAPAWASAVWGMELVLPERPEPTPVVVATPLPAFPGVERDLALLVRAGVTAGAVRAVIEAEGRPLLRSVEVFDLYEGKELPDGHRSVAHRLRFQSADRTLTDDEVERSTGRILKKLKEELGVEPRG